MFALPQLQPDHIKQLSEHHWLDFSKPEVVVALLKRHRTAEYNEVDLKLTSQTLCPQIATLHPNHKSSYDVQVVTDPTKIQSTKVVEFRVLVLNSAFKSSERYSFAGVPTIDQNTAVPQLEYKLTVQLKSKYGTENEPVLLFFACLVVVTPKMEVFPGCGIAPYCVWIGDITYPRGFVAHISNKPVEKRGEDGILQSVLSCYWTYFRPTDIFTEIRLHFRQELNHKKGTRELDDEDLTFFKNKVNAGGLTEEVFVDVWKFVYYIERILRKNDNIRKDWNDRRIEGVMSKEQANERLKDRLPGTFLFRFSGTTHEMLVVSYTKEKHNIRLFRHLQIRVQKDKLVVLNGKTVPVGIFPTLAQLVLGRDTLQYAYCRDPHVRQTAKHAVFLPKSDKEPRTASDRADSDYDDEDFL